jgi:NTP pyrophosphatase (non-canonical NTP hydrolase)
LKNKIFKATTAKWGVKHQINAAIEELAELIVELSKELTNKNNGEIHNIIDEIADVKIMIAQLEYNFDIHKEVKSRYKVKLEGLKNKVKAYL